MGEKTGQPRRRAASAAERLINDVFINRFPSLHGSEDSNEPTPEDKENPDRMAVDNTPVSQSLVTDMDVNNNIKLVTLREHGD